jgi:hypothetical protein
VKVATKCHKISSTEGASLGQRNYKPAHNVPGIYKVLVESKKLSLMHGTVPLFIVVRYNFV